MAHPPPEPDIDVQSVPRSRWAPLATVAIVLGSLTILAGLVLPALAGRASWGSRKSSCGNNQRQIVLSALVYANDNANLLPCRPTDATGAPARTTTAIDGFCTAAASLEYLTISSNGDLPNKSFNCPSNTTTNQLLATWNPSQPITYTAGISAWGANHLPFAAGGPGAMAYAYDWSAPPSAGVNRVMTIDRGTITVAHRMIAMACAADGHVFMLSLIPRAGPSGAHVTRDEFGGVEAVSGIATDSSTAGHPDDVYDDQDDDGAEMVPGCGSSTRAWVR
jgi:hypothetical protein